MKATLLYQVEVEDEDDLDHLRSMLDQLLDDEDIRVSSSKASIDEKPYTAFGSIRGQPDEHWQSTVNAVDAKGAKEAVLAEDENRTVVAILAGEWKDALANPEEGDSVGNARA